MLVVEGLTKRYGKTLALDGFSLEVRAGEVTGLIGHNGAGKTTFVEVTTGLVRPGAGRVTVCGIDALAEPRAARALFGVAPQELALYPTVTVREHLGLFAGLAGLRRAAAARSVEAVAEELVLGDVLDRRCAVLSGGQRRRTQAAAAMVGSPRVLLLDEPTAGADPETRQALLAAVRARADAGAAVVYTTHYLPELVDLDATLAVARAGRVVARGERAALTSGLPGEVRVALDPDRPRPGSPPSWVPVPGTTGRAGCGSPPSIHAADLAALLTAGCAPLAVDVRRPDLDDLYAALATSAPKALATPPGTEAEFASGGFVDGGRQPEPGAGVLAMRPAGAGRGRPETRPGCCRRAYVRRQCARRRRRRRRGRGGWRAGLFRDPVAACRGGSQRGCARLGWRRIPDLRGRCHAAPSRRDRRGPARGRLPSAGRRGRDSPWCRRGG